MDSDNCLNEVFSSFDRLYKELSLSFHLVDIFPDHFFPYSKSQEYSSQDCLPKKLDKIFDNSILNPNTVIVISNVIIKNNVTTLISHICNGQNIIAKTIHHIMNVTSTEVELFAIRCRINQAVKVLNIEQIIVITDTILAARQYFWFVYLFLSIILYYYILRP